MRVPHNEVILSCSQLIGVSLVISWENLVFWVYLLRCSDGSYYTGHTDDLERRMAQYQAGECKGYIAARMPVELVWSQETATREEALSAEQQIKGWSRKKKEALIRGDWAEISRLAKSKSVRPELVEG
ncbi:MAG: GIY-YIG nuclease family protein [Gammaproteobacteria bacterium]|nr:MAG: GIY-YIG nuclease family protein [Gammaproteobacteria bacterium]